MIGVYIFFWLVVGFFSGGFAAYIEKRLYSVNQMIGFSIAGGLTLLVVLAWQLEPILEKNGIDFSKEDGE